MTKDYKNRTGQVPRFTLEERDRRWREVRERMYQRGLDALMIWANDRNWGMAKANLRYLTQVPGQPDAIGLFPLQGEPTVWSEIPHMHKPYDVYECYNDWIEESRPLQGVEPIIKELKERGLDTGSIGLVSYGSMHSTLGIPHHEYQAVHDALPGAELVEATDLVERTRLIKSEEEIARLRRAGKVARAMGETLVEVAEPGRTEAEVYADMVRTQLAEGGEAWVFNLLDSGSPTDSDFEHLLHGKGQPLSPSQRTLNEGDIIITEYHGNYGGYLAAAETSVALGDVPQALHDIWDVCLECHEISLDVMRPGARLEDVWQALREPAESAGMDYVELGFHGHGLGSPEFPTTVYPQESTSVYPDGLPKHPMSGAKTEDFELKKGMVFGTQYDLFDPEFRNDVGLQYGDMLLITEEEPEPLVNTPDTFVV